MANETDKINELAQDIEDSLANVRKSSDGLVGSLERMMDGNDLTRRSFKKLDRATGGLVSSFEDAAKQIMNGSDSLSVLTGVVADVTSKIPLIGSAISGAVKILGQQAQLGMDAFHRVSAAGQLAGDGIVGIANDLRRVDIPIDRWTELLGKSSTSLRYFTGSALAGRKHFTDTMEALRQGVDEPLRRLGLRIDDIGELTVAFQKMQQRQGILQDVDQNRRAIAAQKYIKQLDLLSKLTGESAKALQAQRDELLADSRFRAWDRRMRREGREDVANAMSDAFLLMGKEAGGAQMQEFIKGMIGGTFTGEKAKAIAGVGGGREMLMLTEQLKRGEISGVEMYNQLIEVSRQYPHFAERLQELGFDLGINFAELADFAQRSLVTNKELTEAQKAQAEQIRKRGEGEPADPTALLVEAIRGLNAATGEMQATLVGEGSIAYALNFAAKTTESIANLVSNSIQKLDEIGGTIGDFASEAWQSITGTFESAVQLFNNTVDRIASFFNRGEWAEKQAKQQAEKRKEERRQDRMVQAEKTIQSTKNDIEQLTENLKNLEEMAAANPNINVAAGIERTKQLIAEAQERQKNAQLSQQNLAEGKPAIVAKPTTRLVPAVTGPKSPDIVTAPPTNNINVQEQYRNAQARHQKLREQYGYYDHDNPNWAKQPGRQLTQQEQQKFDESLKQLEVLEKMLSVMQDQNKKLDNVVDETKKQSRTIANTN